MWSRLMAARRAVRGSGEAQRRERVAIAFICAVDVKMDLREAGTAAGASGDGAAAATDMGANVQRPGADSRGWACITAKLRANVVDARENLSVVRPPTGRSSVAGGAGPALGAEAPGHLRVL